METEDFTFLITTNNTNTKPCINSEPWWCITHSSTSSEKSENKEAEDLESCCLTETWTCYADKKGGTKVENDQEENMDLLWEDFNDEMIKISCGLLVEPEMPSMRMAGLGCGAAFKLVKAGGGRKPGAGAFLKVLRRLLLHHTRPC